MIDKMKAHFTNEFPKKFLNISATFFTETKQIFIDLRKKVGGYILKYEFTEMLLVAALIPRFMICLVGKAA